MLAMKSAGWCLLGYWLSIFLMKETFCATAASWEWWNEREVLLMYSTNRHSHYAAMDRRRLAKLAWGMALAFA
jgi:hypothetical protein